MKRTYLLLAGTIMYLSTFTACSDETDEQNLSDELKQVVATVKDFVPEADSRAFNLVNNSVEFAWEDGDTIGIFPNTGAQAYFPILPESAGTNTASFTGGGWALKSSSTYAAYYPFIGDFYMSQKEIPVNYEGQKQTGNASMNHLSTHDFMAASGSTPSSGKVNFQFAHLGAFVQLKITMPQGGTLTSVTLSADQAVFTTEGTIDLTAATPAIKSVTKSKTLTLEVENVTTTAESNVATLYMMLAPVDFTNRTLSAIVKTSDGKSETITLTGKNFEAGKAYGVTGAMKDPNGGTTAGNGTYKDGVVSVDVAGNMKKLLGDDYLNITSLKVVGPINGDDVYYLRKMLSGSDFSEADWGKLTTLDLSEATIVEGGEWYYKYSSSKKYYTTNNGVGDYMFYQCANLKNIVLPNSVTSIGYQAFYMCDALTTVEIGNSVTSIGSSAFNDCDALTTIKIPDCVTSIGESAFYRCAALTTVEIGNSVTSIGEYAFYYCNALTTVEIGNSVTSIGKSAFSYCDALTSVYITDLSAWCKIDFNNDYSNPLHDGRGKLYLNDNLVTELVIPDDVTEIKSYTFCRCSSLTKVTIPDHVTSIGKYAFSSCNALTTVEIGNSVTSIGEYAFIYCYALTTIKIPNSVTSIGESAFWACSALTTVEIGNSVTSIGSSAFQYCSIKECYCYASTPPSMSYNYSGHSPFYDGVEGATLYVPARCGAVYKASSWGNCFTNIVEMD